MQSLALFVILCFLIAIGYSASDLNINSLDENSLISLSDSSIGSFSSDLDVNSLDESSFTFPSDSSVDYFASNFDVNSLDKIPLIPPSDSSIQETNSFDQSTDSSNFLDLLNASNVQETNPLDRSTDTDIDWLLNTDDQFSPDSSFSLADDIICDVNDAADTQLFDKRRRDAACQNPEATSTDSEDINKLNNLFNPQQLLNIMKPKITDLKENQEACPTEVFDDSNIPVCKHAATLLTTPNNLPPVTLTNVDPGAFSCEYEFESVLT